MTGRRDAGRRGTLLRPVSAPCPSSSATRTPRPVRDRLVAFVRGALRTQRMAPLAAAPSWSRPAAPEDGGWEIVLVRHGRLAGTTCSPARRRPPCRTSRRSRPAGEVVAPGRWPAPAALPEETEKILRWLEPARRAHGARRRRVDVPRGRCRLAARARSTRWAAAASRVPGFDRPPLAAPAAAGLRTYAPPEAVITAIVLIETDVDRIPEAAAEIAEIDGVSEVYSVTGDIDLVAMVRVREHERAGRRHRRPGQQGPGRAIAPARTSRSARTPSTTSTPRSTSASTG